MKRLTRNTVLWNSNIRLGLQSTIARGIRNKQEITESSYSMNETCILLKATEVGSKIKEVLGNSVQHNT